MKQSTTVRTKLWHLCWLVAGLALLLLVEGRNPLARADAPQSSASALPGSQHPIALSAGDDGPLFTLDDLAAYAARPLPRWEIRPPVWNTYPSALDEVPVVPREYPADTVRYLAEHEVHHGDRAHPHVALTFDCEAGAGSVDAILAVLREHRVKATFFVLGRYAYRNPETVRQIVTGGHEVGNHSFFHPLFTSIPQAEIAQEIAYTEAAVDWAVGRHVPMRYIRFPYGGRNRHIRTQAAEMGYQSAFWDIDPRGWDDAHTAEDVVAHVQRTAHNGGIVIMHCHSWDDARALPGVIQGLRQIGMTPGTLTSVLAPADRDVPGYDSTQ